MAEETKVRKKKKRKKKNYLLRIFLFVIICAGLYFLLNLSFFDVSKIDVKNNSYYTAEQIAEKGGIETGENIFFDTRTRKIKKALLKDAYIQNVKVSRKLPSTIVIDVDERAEAAAVRYGDIYVIIDESGLVLRHSEVEPKLTLLEGLTLKSIDPGKPLEAEENYMLSDTLEIIRMMTKSEVYFKSIDLSGVMVKAYIYDHLICIGTPEAVAQNLENGGLQQVLYDLYSQGVERGTVTVNSDGTCAFSGEID